MIWLVILAVVETVIVALFFFVFGYTAARRYTEPNWPKPSPAASATPQQSTWPPGTICPVHRLLLVRYIPQHEHSPKKMFLACPHGSCQTMLTYVPSSVQSDTTGTATPPGESLIVRADGTPAQGTEPIPDSSR